MNKQEYDQLVKTFNDYLERIDTAIRHFCEDLEASYSREISEVLPAIIDGLGWIYEALHGFTHLGKISEDTYNDFRGVIGALHEALENKDYILLHDVMEYELLPLLEKLKINQLI